MRYKVILEIEEYVEATSAVGAKQAFKDNLEWADINDGTYHVEPQWGLVKQLGSVCGEAWSMGDRVEINYVIDRIEDILTHNACQLDDTGAEVRDCVRKDMLEEFKRELIYNLGVNQRNRNNG
jgi:hypothetical protein